MMKVMQNEVAKHNEAMMQNDSAMYNQLCITRLEHNDTELHPYAALCHYVFQPCYAGWSNA